MVRLSVLVELQPPSRELYISITQGHTEQLCRLMSPGILYQYPAIMVDYKI
jgi:hypothetical protein